MKPSRTVLLVLALILAGAGALYAFGVVKAPSLAGVEKLQDPGY